MVKHAAELLPSPSLIHLYYPPPHPYPPPPPYPPFLFLSPRYGTWRQVLYKSNCGVFHTCESNSDLICAAHSDCLAEECEIDTCVCYALLLHYVSVSKAWVWVGLVFCCCLACPSLPSPIPPKIATRKASAMSAFAVWKTMTA
jgi:hypothetical protein